MKTLLFCILLLASEAGLSAQVIPLRFLGFKTNAPLPTECRAALLATPEQNAALEAAWKETSAVTSPIEKLGAAATAEQQQLRAEALQAFTKKCDAIFTQEQIEIRTLISELGTSVFDSVNPEFASRIDAATTPAERNSIALERNAAFQQQFLQQLASSLPPKNLEAFQASQKK